MDGVILPGRELMQKRKVASRKQVNFCLSIVMDTTGSMDPYINATRDNIVQILNQLKRIERDYRLPVGGIVGQVVQYKDFEDTLHGEKVERITSDFEWLKYKLASFRASGGGDTCEDIQGGLIRALEQMNQPPYDKYNHLILVVGDAHNHEDGNKGNGCSYDFNETYKMSFDEVWTVIYRRIRRFKGIRVMFMPVSDDLLLRTAFAMQSALGSEIVDSAAVTTETNFVQVVTNTTIKEYKRFVGIS